MDVYIDMARIPPCYGALSGAGVRRRSSLHIGEDVEGVDAGVTIPAQLTVNVFKDTQADGVKGAYEENFEGISVTLIHIENGEDAESVTYKTDEEGNVTFAGVSPGEYAIAYQLLGQWRATRQVSAASGQITSNVPQTTLSAGRSEPFTLTMGQTGVKIYIGAMLSGSISGVVYYDDDADAKLGANETYCRGATVELLSSAGEVVASAQTAEDGSYAFEGVAPGTLSRALYGQRSGQRLLRDGTQHGQRRRAAKRRSDCRYARADRFRRRRAQ